jgi:hypothetical protein
LQVNAPFYRAQPWGQSLVTVPFSRSLALISPPATHRQRRRPRWAPASSRLIPRGRAATRLARRHAKKRAAREARHSSLVPGNGDFASVPEAPDKARLRREPHLLVDEELGLQGQRRQVRRPNLHQPKHRRHMIPDAEPKPFRPEANRRLIKSALSEMRAG